MLAQTWPDRVRGAVSLTYDGGDLSHLETVAPCLAALGLRATFYVPPSKVLESAAAWKSIAGAGHELGSFSLSEAATPDGYLLNWTEPMLRDDIDQGEAFHQEVFPGSAGHSFAYPLGCADDTGNIEILQHYAFLRPIVKERFSIARGIRDGTNSPSECDLLCLRCLPATDCDAEELIAVAEQAALDRSWAIFAFRGVGVGDPGLDAVQHARFCLWLAESSSRVHVDTVFRTGTAVAHSRHAVVEESQGARATLRTTGSG